MASQYPQTPGRESPASPTQSDDEDTPPAVPHRGIPAAGRGARTDGKDTPKTVYSDWASI